ncbi:hypothetical protein HWD35_23150 [Tsukamurella tyrosinosolvens]|uniref:hypothetical protein n=1 Tax=Tsukamurella tyrosinosolvens TaxID=57704 RepID=UPI001CE0CEFA|nr:hypothetical protein [Tsukamurella tyrosinosolvens]MCA4997624.1 hypothetical protein [Tsukamurella tyrosinosolvens]
MELLGDLIVGGFPEAVFTLPGVSVDEVLDHARLYLGFAEAAESAHARVRGLEVPEFVGVEGEFFRGRVPGELAMQLGAAVESYSRVGSGIKELARELDASQAALKPLEARARAVFEHMQRVWIKVNVPFTEYSGLRSEWDELVRAAGVVHERVAVAGQQAAAAITAGTEAMVPVNDYFSTLPGGAVAGGALAQSVRSTAARAVSAAGGVAWAPGRAAKATADGLGAVAGAAVSVPQQITARGQQLAPQVTPDGIKVGDQLLTDPTSEQAQKLVRDGQATNILGLDPTGVPTAMMMLASPNTLLREQPRKKAAGRRWTGEDSKAQSIAQSAVGQVVSVPGRFVGGAVDRFGNTIAGNAALIGVGGDPVRAWTGLLSNVTSPVAGAGRAVASATPEQILADPIAAAGSAATHAPVAVPFVGWAYGLVEWATKPGELAREGAKETLTSALDALTLKNLEAGQAVANTGEVHVTTSDVDVHADHGGYVTFTLPDLEGGEPKAWYILATPDSPGNFTTNVPTAPGEELVERGDGSVVLVNTATGQIVRTIKTPWAKDALGRDQPTWYSIDKVDDVTSTITQHIAPNKNALYPLVADATNPAPGSTQTKNNIDGSTEWSDGTVTPAGFDKSSVGAAAPAGAGAGASIGQSAGGSAPTVQHDGFSGPTSTNAVNAPYERPQGSAGTTTTPPAQAEPYKPDPGTRPGSTPKVDPKPYTPNPAPAAPPKPDSESGQDDDKQSATYVGAVTDTGSSFRDVSGSEVGVKSVADPTINTGGVPAPGDRSAELTRLVQSGLMNSAMLQALGYHVDPSGKVVKDTGPIVSVELAPDLGQSPVAGLIVPQLQAGGAQVKVKEPVPGTPQDNDISSVSIGDPAKQVDTHLVRGDGATSRTQTTRTPDGSLDTVTETFDGARIDGHTTLGPDGKPVSSSWNDSAGNRGVLDNTDPQQRRVVREAGGGVSASVTTGEIGNVSKTTTITASGEVIRTATTDTGRDSNVELLPNPDMGALPEGTNGRREGDTWITHLANGDRVENTIPFGNGNRTVDQTIYGPDGKITHSRVVSDGAGGWRRWNNDSTGEASYASKPGLDGWTNVANFAPGAATTGAPTSQSLITPNFKEAVQRTPDGGYIRSKIVPDTTGVHGGADSVETTTVDSGGNTTVTMSRPAPFLGGGPVTTTTAQYDHNGDGWFINDRGQKFIRTGNTITTTDPATGNKIVTQLAPADTRSPDPAIRDREQVTSTRTYSPDGKPVSAVFGEGQIRPGTFYTPDGRSMQVELRPDGVYSGDNEYLQWLRLREDGTFDDGLGWVGKYATTVGSGVLAMSDGVSQLIGQQGWGQAGKAWSAMGDSFAGLVGQDEAGRSVAHNNTTFWTGTNANEITEKGTADAAGNVTVAALGLVPGIGWAGKLGRAGKLGATVARGFEIADTANMAFRGRISSVMSSALPTVGDRIFRRADGEVPLRTPEPGAPDDTPNPPSPESGTPTRTSPLAHPDTPTTTPHSASPKPDKPAFTLTPGADHRAREAAAAGPEKVARGADNATPAAERVGTDTANITDTPGPVPERAATSGTDAAKTADTPAASDQTPTTATSTDKVSGDAEPGARPVEVEPHSREPRPAQPAPPRDEFDPQQGARYNSGDPYHPGGWPPSTPAATWTKGDTTPGWEHMNRGPEKPWMHYQEQITGIQRTPDGRIPEYVLINPETGAHVRMDSGPIMRGDQMVFIDAKREYAPLFKYPSADWVDNIKTDLLMEAQRQLDALPEGAILEWHVANPQSAAIMRELLESRGLDVDVIYTPHKR